MCVFPIIKKEGEGEKERMKKEFSEPFQLERDYNDSNWICFLFLAFVFPFRTGILIRRHVYLASG